MVTSDTLVSLRDELRTADPRNEPLSEIRTTEASVVAELLESLGRPNGPKTDGLADEIERHLASLRTRHDARPVTQGWGLRHDLYVEPCGSADPPSAAAATWPTELWSAMRPSLERGLPCAVLAEFGTGKSWFLEMIQHRLAIARGVPWIPLRLKLRSFRREASRLPAGLAALLGAFARPRPILDELRDQLWTAAFGESVLQAKRDAMVEAFEQGRFLLLLDALDEMGSGARDEADLLLSEVGKLSSHTLRSPVILTCRRSHFRDPSGETRLRDLGFELFYLWPWSPAHVRDYLERSIAAGRLTVSADDALAVIGGTYDLTDLTSRALLAAMLVDQWDAALAAKAFDLPSLYERHVEKALLTWQASKAHHLTMEQLRWYMEELAFLMFRLDALTLEAKDLDEYFGADFRRLRAGKSSALMERLQEIQTNSLLLRDGTGYAFCHVSFWEFLVARKLRRALAEDDRNAFAILHRSSRYHSIVGNFLVPMLLRDHREDWIEKLLQGGAA
jgi:predicted NACHT family NTPase